MNPRQQTLLAKYCANSCSMIHMLRDKKRLSVVFVC